jgi:hypothetical protein
MGSNESKYQWQDSVFALGRDTCIQTYTLPVDVSNKFILSKGWDTHMDVAADSKRRFTV